MTEHHDPKEHDMTEQDAVEWFERLHARNARVAGWADATIGPAREAAAAWKERFAALQARMPALPVYIVRSVVPAGGAAPVDELAARRAAAQEH